jgi:hypothetical protein
MIATAQPCALPASAFLAECRREGGYTDCYCIDIDRVISQPQYLVAFYTTPLFKLERLLLKWAVAKPSTDAQAAQLADGSRDGFAAWQVERRAADQLLMRDYTGRTKSWLMSEAIDIGGRKGTRLYFGSAVMPRFDRNTGRQQMGFAFSALLGFHRLYSRALLYAARLRL